jgi:hypothetical protein
MHRALVREIVKACMQRQREGDCPTVQQPHPESLEDCIVALVGYGPDQMAELKSSLESAPAP